ncbi:hemerythrin domain-containing protein [Nocardioides panaciterrulae]|uniref:Hemerythrin-like domain-containing protein n=1 Tax=Nocardioides panaciterrulae TaxID=661492 RepID=A0A7Y9E3N4_9ACTN|nr:hemerythrin domain-containing protein [Nocardioides panaciterrulae]NYD40638.1 hemerythrin-like domain-containing protein [Nocardioides panaciterrulae]
MCEHCGCRGVPPVAELMDEHLALLDEAHRVRAALGRGDRAAAVRELGRLRAHLERHVRREERGIFSALRADGEFVAEVDALEAEHRGFDSAAAALDGDGDGDGDAFERAVLTLLGDLDEHVERENLGIFPVSVVTLGAAGWDRVARAHEATPTFLTREPSP